MGSVNELGNDSGCRSSIGKTGEGRKSSVLVCAVTGFCVVGGATLLSGCAAEAVKPWQRGKLARPDMQGTPDKLSSLLRDHAYFSKEGTSGSASSGGGGCGCN